jgi:hypothetical protein
MTFSPTQQTSLPAGMALATEEGIALLYIKTVIVFLIIATTVLAA